jgi:hypothetical protein
LFNDRDELRLDLSSGIERKHHFLLYNIFCNTSHQHLLVLNGKLLRKFENSQSFHYLFLLICISFLFLIASIYGHMFVTIIFFLKFININRMQSKYYIYIYIDGMGSLVEII